MAGKSTLRDGMSALANGTRGDSDRRSARPALRRVVLDRCAIERWTSVAAYVPLRTEPGSVELLDELVGRGVRVRHARPAAGQGPGLAAVGRASARTRSAPMPSRAVDAVLVPALAVAADGTRLGRGGGSYDRALARVAAGTTIAALLFDGETAAVNCPPTRGTCR